MSESRNPQALLASTLNKVPFIMQILAGLIIGVIIGAIYPNDHTVLPTMGSLFVKALKSVAPILVFVLVAAAIARHEKGTQSNMRPIVVVYFISMVLASTLALSMSYIFPSTFSELASAADDLSPPQGIAEVLTNFVNQAIDNPVTALMNGNYIAILFWAIALGLMFRTAHDNTKKVLEDLTQSVAGVVRIIIRFAPLGVMGLVYSSVTQEGGFANLLNYVHVLLVLIGSMLLIGFVLNAGIVYYMTRENPYPLIFTCVARSGVTAFFTRSSADQSACKSGLM